jgi:hypothetical protein
MSREQFEDLKRRREASWANWFHNDEDTCVPDSVAFPIDALPPAATEWPEVATIVDVLAADTGSRPMNTAPLQISIPMAQSSTHWLLHPALVGRYLDVEVKNASNIYKGLYDNSIGVIEELPVVKKGIRGSAVVKIGIALATRRPIKVTSIFPLQTNEFEGYVPKELARSVLDVIGTYVVIIGPDAAGSDAYVGKMGFVTEDGRISVDGVLRWFPIQSVCRSDPFPKP